MGTQTRFPEHKSISTKKNTTRARAMMMMMMFTILAITAQASRQQDVLRNYCGQLQNCTNKVEELRLRTVMILVSKARGNTRQAAACIDAYGIAMDWSLPQ